MGHWWWWHSVTPGPIQRPVCENGHGPRFGKPSSGTPTRPRRSRSPHDRPRRPGSSAQSTRSPQPGPRRTTRTVSTGTTRRTTRTAAGRPVATGSCCPVVMGRRQQAFTRSLWAGPAASRPAEPVRPVPLVPRQRTWVIVRGFGPSPVAAVWSAGRRHRRTCRGVHNATTRRVGTAPRRRPVRRVTAVFAVRPSAGGRAHGSGRSASACRTGRPGSVWRIGRAGSARRTGSLSGVLSGRR
jgi:hypothetical protein